MLLCTFASALAFDFEVDGIFYNCDIESRTASVTSKGTKEQTYIGNVVIPSSVSHNGVSYTVTRIEDWAFSNSLFLESVQIPNTVTTIGESAFYECRKLKEIIIPNSVRKIGTHTFFFCYELVSAKLSENITEIGDCMFLCCKKLKTVNIPEGVTRIGKNAFDNCESLESITIPQSVTEICANAFAFISPMVTSVVVPNANAKVHYKAFNEGIKLLKSKSEDEGFLAIYKVVDKNNNITYFKLEKNPSGNNTVRIKYVSSDGRLLKYEGLEYTYFGKWYLGTKEKMKGIIIEGDNEKLIRGLYVSFTGVVGEAHQRVFISNSGVLMSYREDSPTLRNLERIEDGTRTTNEELDKEERIRKNESKQYSIHPQNNESTIRAKTIYKIMDGEKTIYIKLDEFGNVYFSYEGRLFGKTYNKNEYRYFGTWVENLEKDGRRYVKLKYDYHNGNAHFISLKYPDLPQQNYDNLTLWLDGNKQVRSEINSGYWATPSSRRYLTYDIIQNPPQ